MNPAPTVAAPVEPTPKRRYKGRGTATIEVYIPEPWEPRFLEHYGKFGGLTNAAKVAGVTVPYVKKRQSECPQFAENYHLAHEQFVDALEERLVEMGRGSNMPAVVAILARLKKERPVAWNEKLQITGAVVHAHTAIPPAEMQGLLQSMLKDAMPETRKAITGEVIEAEA